MYHLAHLASQLLEEASSTRHKVLIKEHRELLRGGSSRKGGVVRLPPHDSDLFGQHARPTLQQKHVQFSSIPFEIVLGLEKFLFWVKYHRAL